MASHGRSDRRAPWSDDSGSASLEFITAGMILLLPIVYLIVAMASIQGGALAVEGAARHAARVFVLAQDEDDAQSAARRAVEFALADHGVDPAGSTVVVRCEPDPSACLSRESAVTVEVTVVVPLPLVPAALDVRAPLRVPLAASATHTVSRFWAAAP
ncbi:hypothetical protein [Marisediminicola sp. LYQ134]|uniref:hypothetical protein n=1 Tax=unclassified Marisediminicola TaxID=2618316 RepID=UPI0039835AD5